MCSRVAVAGHEKLMEERDEWAGTSCCLRGGLMGSPGMWRWGLLDPRVRLLLALMLLFVSSIGRVGNGDGMGVSAAWLGCGGVVMGTGGVGSSSSSDILRSMVSTGTAVAGAVGAVGADGPVEAPNVQPVPAQVKTKLFGCDVESLGLGPLWNNCAGKTAEAGLGELVVAGAGCVGKKSAWRS